MERSGLSETALWRVKGALTQWVPVPGDLMASGSWWGEVNVRRSTLMPPLERNIVKARTDRKMQRRAF